MAAVGLEDVFFVEEAAGDGVDSIEEEGGGDTEGCPAIAGGEVGLEEAEGNDCAEECATGIAHEDFGG